MTRCSGEGYEGGDIREGRATGGGGGGGEGGGLGAVEALFGGGAGAPFVHHKIVLNDRLLSMSDNIARKIILLYKTI